MRYLCLFLMFLSSQVFANTCTRFCSEDDIPVRQAEVDAYNEQVQNAGKLLDEAFKFEDEVDPVKGSTSSAGLPSDFLCDLDKMFSTDIIKPSFSSAIGDLRSIFMDFVCDKINAEMSAYSFDIGVDMEAPYGIGSLGFEGPSISGGTGASNYGVDINEKINVGDYFSGDQSSASSGSSAGSSTGSLTERDGIITDERSWFNTDYNNKESYINSANIPRVNTNPLGGITQDPYILELNYRKEVFKKWVDESYELDSPILPEDMPWNRPGYVSNYNNLFYPNTNSNNNTTNSVSNGLGVFNGGISVQTDSSVNSEKSSASSNLPDMY